MHRLANSAAIAALAVWAGGSASAQEACQVYQVRSGDNLRNISRSAYGDPDKYRLVFEANRDAIGRSADLIAVGMTLVLPCDDGTVPQEVAAVAAQPEVAAEAPPPDQPLPERPRLMAVTGNGFPPFTDERLPGRGMFTQLVEMALFRADPERDYAVSFVNDWQSHLDVLLPSGAFGLSFPWLRPACEQPETLSDVDRGRCDSLAFSDPFFESVDGFFALTESGLASATSTEEFRGKRICRPEGADTGVLDRSGLVEPVVELLRPTTPRECFEMLVAGSVDLVALDTAVGADEVRRQNLTGKVAENPQLSTITSLHVIALKSNTAAVADLALLNTGLREMYESGEWHDIVSEALEQHRKVLSQ